MTSIRKTAWPKVFEACEAISHDRGTGAGHESYDIPTHWVEHMDDIEEALKSLTPEQFEIITIGERGEAEDIIKRSVHRSTLNKADRFLNQFFNEFCPGA